MLYYLIGPMGSGKSTIGRALAARLSLPFIDTDVLIENAAGMSIPDIFAREGETAFRDREVAAIASTSACAPAVVATGGGAVLRAENRELMRSLGRVIYLFADLETLLARTSGDANRPLLQVEDRRAKLASLMAFREPLYRETAHLAIDTSSLSLDEVVTRCLAPH